MPIVLSVLALLLAAPAFAAAPVDDDLDMDDGLERGAVKKSDDKKKKEPAALPTLDEDEEPVEEFDNELDLEDEPDADIRLGDFEGGDDEPLEDFERPTAKPKPAAAASKTPGVIALDVAGKEPLGDNYPLSVVAVDRDAVVIELPVLVARSRAGFEKAFVIVGEVYVGKIKVGEVRQTIEAASLAEFGPSFAWLKVLAPVVEGTGEIKIVVRRTNVDGTVPVELFSRVTPYSLR